ncbi:MAG: ATP-binding protein [Pseudomonadota bacterium]
MTRNARALRLAYTRQYLFGLALIAALSGASLLFMFEKASGQSGRAEIVALASGQKALSQRVAFYANAFANSANAVERGQIRAELLDTVEQMRAAHEKLSLKGEADSRTRAQLKSVARIYFNDFAPFDDDVRGFMDVAEKVAAEGTSVEERATLLGEINLLAMQTIMQSHDVIARIITHDAEREIAQVKMVQTAILGLIVLLLALEAALIFEPMGRKVEQSVHRSETSEALAQAQARRANDALEVRANFLRVVSHELRTPLNAIIGMTKLLQNSELAPLQRDYLRHLGAAGEHMLGIADDLLTINQLDAGLFELAIAPASLRDEIEKVTTLLGGRAKEKGLSIRIICDDALAPAYAVDARRMRQVVFNLICNAIKFTNAGFVEIDLRRAEIGDDGRHGIELRVRDTGCGVPPERRTKIFDDFEQAGAFSERTAGGVGLGLPISRRLVNAMGGRLALESSSLSGSVFLIDLPLQPAQAVPATEPETAHSENAAASPGRILVVDDNLPNRMIAAAYLKKGGFDIIFAENGEQAIAACDAAPDLALVFMDIEMPVMDGVEATRRLKAAGGRHRAVPIVALTAHALPEDADKLRAAGFDDVLRKPATQEILITSARRFADKRRAA